MSGLDHSRFGIKGHVLDRRSLGSLEVELGLAEISIDKRYKKRNGGDQQREKEENVSLWSQRLDQISRGELPLDPMASDFLGPKLSTSTLVESIEFLVERFLLQVYLYQHFIYKAKIGSKDLFTLISMLSK